LFGVFAISTVARLIVVSALLMPLAEVRIAAHASTRTLIFRMARLNAVTGMVMDVAGVIRTGRGKEQVEGALGKGQRLYQRPRARGMAAAERLREHRSGISIQTPTTVTDKPTRIVEQEA
jgi:hypothetical protein